MINAFLIHSKEGGLSSYRNEHNNSSSMRRLGDILIFIITKSRYECSTFKYFNLGKFWVFLDPNKEYIIISSFHDKATFRKLKGLLDDTPCKYFLSLNAATACIESRSWRGDKLAESSRSSSRSTGFLKTRKANRSRQKWQWIRRIRANTFSDTHSQIKKGD